MPKNLRCTEADFGWGRGIQNGPENELQRVGQLIELLSVFLFFLSRFTNFPSIYLSIVEILFVPSLVVILEFLVSIMPSIADRIQFSMYFFPTFWSFRITFTTRFTFSYKTMMNLKGDSTV